MTSLTVDLSTDGSLPYDLAGKVTPPASDAGDCQDGSFGYDFEDKQTRAQLQLIDDLQKLGVSKYLDLPQLVVVGDQSTGKSSVLQAVTEIPFAINDDMCTRFATEIVLERSPPNCPTEIKVSIIPDPDDSPERKQELLAWHPVPFDSGANLDKVTIQDIFQQANDIIFGSTAKRSPSRHGRSKNGLSSSILRITRRGPKETNFAIVDIPGLVRGNGTNSEHRTAKNLVEKYLKNPRSIVVVVIDVVDLKRQEIMDMWQDLPDAESRVIGVINKCDTKQKKSHDWVFDLIRNDPTQSKAYYLKEGWFGLRNRTASEMGSSDSDRDKCEKEFFAGPEWSMLDEKKLGRHKLKSALISMRNRHVRQSIPQLLSEIQTKLEKCQRQIDQLGEPRTTSQAQFTLINRIATEYSKRAAGAVNGHYEDLTHDRQFARKLIRDDLDIFKADMMKRGLHTKFITSQEDAQIIAPTQSSDDWAPELLKSYAWIRAAINNYRGKEDIGEVNPIVKAQLWKQQIGSWEEIASQALEQVERTVDEANASLFEKACPDTDLRSKLQAWLQDDFHKVATDARVELQRLISSERDGQLFSLHPTMVARKQEIREARIQAILADCILKDSTRALPQAGQTPLKVGTVQSRTIVQSVLDNNAELFGVLNTHDSLAAYYDVAIYRFIDNFALQVVERHLLGPLGPLRLFTCDYVTQKLYGEENAMELNDLAGEDPAIAQQRMDLEAERASLEESKRRVQSFKIL
ncbi:uncharacterized protein PAC_05961 [Phialocephala subalpina]|uniref:GED domain-containing protein n=1 Tax=Phialocephala subalpina TaxID=576137 RepID=A0A1L7WTK5_9HELO|nr:uncharacterized protein PAC_05961 [Phialocephala subalpina]